MTEKPFSTEKQILMAMRKTLAKIVRDLTPADAATRYPLNDDTVQDMKACFDLITTRERELMLEEGIDNKDRPVFIDEPNTPKVVPFKGLSTKQNKDRDA